MSNFADAKTEYRHILGFFWTQVFNDQDFVDGYTDSFLLKFQDSGAYVDTLPAYLSRYFIPLTKASDIRLFSFAEADRDVYAARYGQGFEYGSDLGYGEIQPSPTVVRYPMEAGFSANFLTVGLEDGIILQRGIDYEIDDDVIVFQVDPCTLPGVVKRASTQADGTISFVTFLWGFEVEEDVNALCEFYGVLSGVCTETSQLLKDSINLAWDMRVDGASVLNTVRMLSLIVGADAVTSDGMVQSVFIEGDRVFVVTETDVYGAPLPYQPIVGPGAVLKAGDIIFDAFIVRGANDYLAPEDFEAISLGRGDIAGIEEGILLPNEVGEVVHSLPPGFRSIRVAGGAYLVIDRDNQIVGSVDTLDEVADVILDSPTQYLSFFVGGAGKDVNNFMNRLNTPLHGPSFFQILEEEQGHLPVVINPLQEFRRLFFRDNSTFIKIKGNQLSTDITAQLLGVLSNTYSAGSRIFVILEKQTSEDAYSLADAAEEVTVFYVSTVDESYSEVRDRVIVESVV